MRRLLGFTMLALAVQLVVGTVVQIYVRIPTDHPGASGSGYFGQSQASLSWALSHSPIWLQVHTGLGLLLVLLALVILAISIVTLRGGLFFSALVGLIGIAGAGAAGAAFLDFNQDLDRLLMNIGLALAVVAYTGSLLLVPSARSRY
ncbi:MAG: hypothetical protein J2P38_05710 [Candidatus Dormibacteraeota bacterium]|nr:hypothetical protein [Candidatus Dormibacteraeota bacterium]